MYLKGEDTSMSLANYLRQLQLEDCPDTQRTQAKARPDQNKLHKKCVRFSI